MRIEQISRRPGVMWGMAFGLSLLLEAGAQPGAARPAADSLAKPPAGVLKLDSIALYRVALERPLVRPDAGGKNRTWKEAYMVRIGIAAAPAAGPALDIFLGGDRIPEYGGWKGGIYFWIYDPARLKQIEGRKISYRFGRGQTVEIGTLTLGKQPKRVRERELRE